MYRCNNINNASRDNIKLIAQVPGLSGVQLFNTNRFLGDVLTPPVRDWYTDHFSGKGNFVCLMERVSSTPSDAFKRMFVDKLKKYHFVTLNTIVDLTPQHLFYTGMIYGILTFLRISSM